MRVSKLLGALFLVGGLFVFTRGSGWHAAYIITGVFLGLFGLLLLSRRPVRRWQVKRPRPGVGTRPGRVRVSPSVLK